MTPEPSAADTNRSSVSTKIFMIVAIFSLPIGVLAYLLAANYTPQIASAQLELSGNALQKPLMKTLYGLTTFTNALQKCAAAGCDSELRTQAASIRSGLDEAQAVNVQVGSDLNTTVAGLTQKNQKDLALDHLQSEWKALETASAQVSSPAERMELTAGCDRLASQVLALVNYAGDSSSLILDPDLDSYYLVDVTLLAMPDMVNHIAKSAKLVNKIAAGEGGPGDQALLSNESIFLEDSLNRLSASNGKSFDADAANHGVSPTLRPRLSAALQSYRPTLTNYLSAIQAVSSNPTQTSTAALAAQAAAAQKASLEYWNVAAAELDTLLNMRVSDFQSSRIQALGFSTLAVVVATFIAFLIGRSITKPLQELVRNLGPGATLLGVSVERIAEASHSQIPSQEESQIICEELNAHAENMRKAVLELARHVEGSAAVSRLAAQESGQKYS